VSGSHALYRKNIKVNYRQGAKPVLKMKRMDNGKIDEIAIANWQFDQIDDFVFEKVYGERIEE